MQLTVNGDKLTVPDEVTLAELLAQLGLAKVKVAVELNQQIVPRSQHSDYLLKDGDALEIVHAIGGG
jgi:sulfur carrier protein